MDDRKPGVFMLIVIVAGGTGGHVFPGLAVADELRARGHHVAWMGTPWGLEARIVPAADIPFEQIFIRGLRGKGLLAVLTAPLRMLRALWQAIRVLRRLRPAVVLGMGGFVSGPGGIAAWLLRIPLCIHEQNAVAGLTNRWLSRLAQRVMVAFPDTRSIAGDVRVTGNPVRAALCDMPPPAQRMQHREDARLRLLVLGGSQGARRLNEVVPAAARTVAGSCAIEIRHQCGVRDQQSLTEIYRAAQLHAQVDSFIEDMAAAYGWADLVICRAGALTVAELAAVGVASILIPFPYAVDDHQAVNARWLSERGAALLVPEPELRSEGLAVLLLELAADRTRLMQMAERARSLAQPAATQQVAEHCLEVARADAA